MRAFLLISGWLMLAAAAWAQPAPFVWPQAQSEGRLQAAFFRYETNLDAPPDSAVLHLFADSRYVLEVNGYFLGFGPARFYPEHPCYDTYDLRPFLQAGTNVIAVRVLSNGTYSFQLRRQPAAFWADGFIQTGRQRRDLRAPGDWRCRLSEGLDPQTPHMSFALPAMEVYDARRDPQDWDQPGFDAGGWTRPVPIVRQDAWGPLQPRNIPPLTRTLYRPYALAGACQILPEDVWSFRVKVDDHNRQAFAQSRPLLAFTYIYSPTDQQVTVSTWWGDHYLNGQGPLPQTEAPPTRPYRQLMTLDLKAGWNPFFIKRTTFWGKWDFYLGVPPEAGLALSPQQQRGDPACFLTAGPFPPDKEALLAELEPFTTPDDLPKRLGATWQTHPQRRVPVNPSINNAWAECGESLGLRPDQIEGIEVPGESSLVYDFRYKRLGRILIDFEAPEGTVLDIGFTEDTLGHKPWMLKRPGLYMATRHIAAGGQGRVETLRPYGLRYLQVDVRGPGPVKIHRVRVMEHVYPFEQIGHFACSDAAFNAIWQLGWRTLRVCAEDSYTDTPFRERGLYAGDMLPQIGVTLSGAYDWGLVRRSLELFQDMYVDQFNPGTPAHEDEIGVLEDYPLLTLEALRWYVDHTGDEAFLAALYPAYQRMIEYRLSLRDAQGLIQNERVFIDWIQLDKREVQNTAYHALLARCCQQMAELATRLGRGQDAQTWQDHRAALQASLHTHYWDAEAGAFRDGIKAGQPIDHHFPISSAWPYLFDLTTGPQNEALLAHIATKMDSIGERNRHRETNPYGSFYLLAALYKAGKAAEAERFMRKHWTPMILKHDDTAWENFGDEGIGTLSHAWSGSPTFFLSTQVLGVDLGWPHPMVADTIRIAPQAATIDWAEGVVPHPAGPVSVRWEVRENALWLWYQAPAGVPVVVAPQGRLAGLRLVVNP